MDGGIYLNAAIEKSFVIQVKDKKMGDAKTHPPYSMFPSLNESTLKNRVSDGHRFDLFKDGVAFDSGDNHVQ